MNKHLKSLLTVSVITFSVSACAGHHLHARDANYNGTQCNVSRDLASAERFAEKSNHELQEAIDNTTSSKKIKHLRRLAKEAETLARDIAHAKKMCDAKMDDTDATAAPAHKKHHAAAKPAAAPAAAKPAAEQPM